MPLINLEQFKTLFPETKVEISDEQVKWYVKENIYKGSDPVYENGANEQMQLLIEKANELGLKNFKDLFKHAENKQIKEYLDILEQRELLDRCDIRERIIIQTLPISIGKRLLEELKSTIQKETKE